jgi:hypothetical protein
MRFSPLALALLFVPGLAPAQEPGVAVNMGRGLDNGMSLGLTFKENWTLRPTLGLGYSDVTGFEASIGSTVLRSFPFGERFYAYVGAGVYYSSADGYVETVGGPAQPTGGGTRPDQVNGIAVQGYDDLVYFTAPLGLRARIYGGFEVFVEAAYQNALSGAFFPNQTGQFSGNPSSRFGGTLGISLRMN